MNFIPTEKKIETAVGYGYIREEDKNYAITSIRNNGKNDFAIYTNMRDVIVNSSPVVEFRNGGFVIRGGTSLLGSNHALIIIDGQQANMSQLDAISPLEVASVDILKDGSAAIYGSRGANGVIIVNTRKN